MEAIRSEYKLCHWPAAYYLGRLRIERRVWCQSKLRIGAEQPSSRYIAIARTCRRIASRFFYQECSHQCDVPLDLALGESPTRMSICDECITRVHLTSVGTYQGLRSCM